MGDLAASDVRQKTRHNTRQVGECVEHQGTLTKERPDSSLEDDLFPLPEHIMRWLYSNRSRVEVSESGIPFRRPRRISPVTQSTPSKLKRIFNMQGGLCCYCASPMTLPVRMRRYTSETLPTDAQVINVDESEPILNPLSKPREKSRHRAGRLIPDTEVTLDHLHPKSDGGPGVLSNFAAACRLCNEEKDDLPLVIFLLALRQNNVREVHQARREVRLAIERSKISAGL